MTYRRTASGVVSAVVMTMAASPPLIAQRVDGDFRSGPASGRAEVPIRQLQLSNGTTRYAIPISVGGQPVLVGLDTGSAGLRLLPDAQAGLQSTGKANHEPFGSGVVLDGPIARGQIGVGNRSAVIGVQQVLGVHCAKGGNACAARLGIGRYRVMGDGLPGEGFLGIIGIKPNLDAIPRNPFVQLGIHRWIVSLPQPGSGRPGTLMLNPNARDEAGFRQVPSGQNPGQVLACLYRPTPRPARACGNATLDTGAPGIGVFNAGMFPQAIAGAPARFVFGAPDARSPGMTLRLNDRRQMTKYSAIDKPGEQAAQLRMGVTPYLAYDILYDADRGTMAVRARPSFPGGPAAQP
ncbi:MULTISPECIES: hypothetical protein [unclassified Sphingomonas]|uniref:hypothetical protein n=1 Tax=unclassified Sphingomonas TaxID=196159 RepID=UPI000ABA2262|nr:MULTISPECIES: hypothetical protein [unclassified Sphingomonas]